MLIQGVLIVAILLADSDLFWDEFSYFFWPNYKSKALEVPEDFNRAAIPLIYDFPCSNPFLLWAR